MNNILLASRDEASAHVIMRALGANFAVNWIDNKLDHRGDFADIDMLILDLNFTDFKGLDFLMNVVSKHHIPVLALSSPDDPHTAAEAMQSGAHNFLVKNNDYAQMLPFAVADGIKRFNERISLIRAIEALKRKVSDLEAQLKNAQATIATQSSADGQRPDDIRIREVILKEAVRNLQTGEINLPSYPEVSAKFKQLFDASASIADFCDLVGKDPAISSKLISVANSPIYRGIANVKTLDQALGRIGISETMNYVNLISNRSLYMNSVPKYANFLHELWMHSLAVAYSCKELSTRLKYGDPSEFFLMGLFHDIGKLLLTQIVARLENGNILGFEISAEQFQYVVISSHGKFGECLINRWKLGETFARVARYSEEAEQVAQPSHEMMIVCLANRLALELGYGKLPGDAKKLLELNTVNRLALSAEQLDAIKATVTTLMNNSGTL